MYEQSARSETCTTNNLKPPSKKLWQKMNVQPERRKPDKKQWHGIESPRFVAFSNLPETGDFFFDKVAVIVSTPKPDFDNGKLLNPFHKENTLVASSNNDPLSGIKYVPSEEAPYMWHHGSEKCREEYVVQDGSYTTILEKEKKTKVFRANPAPKFLEARSGPTNTNKHNDNDNRTRDRNDKIKSNANEKAQSTKRPKNPVKKNAEIWKRPPFMPISAKRSLVTPKGPCLHTALRAQERKRFENIIKEKETQREHARQVELAILKKREEKEIARLRKQTVHKAQPIRMYKMCVSKTGKRPLTDPMSPPSFKRRCRA
ncbi:targeting protein for Xklp2 homolog [Andrena cerasifolii]|uniref:targeting protein for Xklp2 homolog n=1 Tax=Andrena cerasifolii TaxID=2819439 RepID=UPI004037DA29